MLLRDGSTIQLPTLRLFCTTFPEPGIGQVSIRPRESASRKFRFDISAPAARTGGEFTEEALRYGSEELSIVTTKRDAGHPL
jgi:hypothetical protein